MYRPNSYIWNLYIKKIKKKTEIKSLTGTFNYTLLVMDLYIFSRNMNLKIKTFIATPESKHNSLALVALLLFYVMLRWTKRDWKGGGGLSAEGTQIKNSPSILYHQEIKIVFNFTREILWRIFVFNFIREIPVKFKNWSCFQFYMINPLWKFFP